MTPRRPPVKCRRCGASASARRPVSFRGLCSECQARAVSRAVHSMVDRTGPEWERYLAHRTEALRRELRRALAQTGEGGGTDWPATYRKPRGTGD